MMYCNLFRGKSYLFFAKITHVVFSGLLSTTRLSLQIDLPACIISDRRGARYAFIKIKLATCHFLLCVVYTCQKSFNFINALACYKQKCKLAPFNLAHPVHCVPQK